MIRPADFNGRGIAALLCALALPASLWGQSSRGSISGLVKDRSGAVIPGATVTVTEENTGLDYTARSKSDGVYLAPDLLPGTYRVSGEAKGFKRLIVGGLNLDVGTTLTQDLTLDVGQVSERITVTGTTSLVDTNSGTVGTTVDLEHILEIPLNQRLVFSLLNLVPGGYYVGGSDNPANTYGTQIAVGGSRGMDVTVTLDGVDNAYGGVAVGNTSVEMNPPPDALQEFRVESSNLSAEFGHASAASVNAVVKNGTNQFHGDFYELVRNDVFDAAGWGATLKPELRRNIPGGTVGGPIRRNKTFFFFAYEDTFNNLGSSTSDSVGLPAWRTGDFSTATRDAGGSAALVPIYDPATGGAQVFPGNVIPSSRLNPVALKALQYVPTANQKPLDPFNNSGNWQSYPVAVFRRPSYIGRLDEELDSKTRLFFRYIDMLEDAHNFGGAAQDPHWGPADAAQHQTRNDQNFALNLTRLFSPSFFLNFTAGVQRLYFHIGNVDDPNISYPQLLGIPNITGAQVPSFSITGGLVPFDSFSGGTNRFLAATNSSYTGGFTKVLDRHTMKFGVQHERLDNNNGSPGSTQFNFSGQYTQGIGANGLPLANTGINLADFLLGLYTSVSASRLPSYGWRAQLYAGYFQDDWRVTQSLTLNLGLRYETLTPVYSPTNELQNFDPTVPNPLAGTNGIPAGTMGITTFENRNGYGKYLWNWDKKTFMPRFGFAYRLFGRSDTVIRGGYGIFFTNPMPFGINSNNTLGFSQIYTASYSPSSPSPLLDQGIPAGGIVPPPASALGPTFGDRGTPFAQSSIVFYYPNRATPYAQQINLMLQRQWKNILFEAGYVGSLGRHMTTNINVNLVPGPLLSQTGVALQLRRPYPQFNGTNASVTSYQDTNVDSSYHSLVLKSERRFNYGMSWLASFVWEKWLENGALNGAATTTSGGSAGMQNIYNRAGEKSLSDYDVPWRLVISPIYELPVGKGKRWLNRGGVVNGAFGGWTASMIATLQSGSPFGPTVLNGGANILGDSSQTERPNILPGCSLTSANQWQPAVGIRGIQYLNPACFTMPAQFTYGDQSRTLPNVFGPGIRQFNVMLSKNFYFSERFRLQFRWQVIDIFNTPQFSLPQLSVGSGTFGIITGQDNMTHRTMELAAKLYW